MVSCLFVQIEVVFNLEDVFKLEVVLKLTGRLFDCLKFSQVFGDKKEKSSLKTRKSKHKQI